MLAPMRKVITGDRGGGIVPQASAARSRTQGTIRKRPVRLAMICRTRCPGHQETTRHGSAPSTRKKALRQPRPLRGIWCRRRLVAATSTDKADPAVVPFGAGGIDGTEPVSSRGYSQVDRPIGRLSRRPGGSGIIGAQKIARAEPMAMKLLFTTNVHVINLVLRQDLRRCQGLHADRRRGLRALDAAGQRVRRQIRNRSQ